jgi:ADP-ribosyl-[dinitrogen reductase] hydrolase
VVDTVQTVQMVQTVLHHLFAADDFETAVVGAVNQGDDPDTTGTLIGMLAGATHGAQALPVCWLHQLDPAVRMAITEQPSALLALREQPWVAGMGQPPREQA